MNSLQKLMRLLSFNIVLFLTIKKKKRYETLSLATLQCMGYLISFRPSPQPTEFPTSEPTAQPTAQPTGSSPFFRRIWASDPNAQHNLEYIHHTISF